MVNNDSTPEIAFIANYLDAPSGSSAVTYKIFKWQDIEAAQVFFITTEVVDGANSNSYEMGISYNNSYGGSSIMTYDHKAIYKSHPNVVRMNDGGSCYDASGNVVTLNQSDIDAARG